MQRRHGFVCRPLALAAMMAIQLPLAAQTTPEPRLPAPQAQSIEIPAQPAAQALQTLVRQHGFQLIYAPDLVRTLHTRAVSGTMSPREALTRMLEGSGLQIVDTGPNSATLRDSAAGGEGNGSAGGASQAAGPTASTIAGRNGNIAVRDAGAIALAREAQMAKRDFDLPAGDALDTVRRLAKESGLTIVFNDDELRGVRTNAVRGEYTGTQALQAVLANTKLWFGVAVASGEITVRRRETIAAVEVTGSHLRSMVNEQSVNPMTVVTRADIERSGVTTLAELRNLVPQLSVGAAASFDGNSSGNAPDGRLTFNLRGLQAGNTLILVDGLRLPRTGSRTVAESYEATGIPMSAIERVEVLMGGGSAIYGADAVGGVVNIITRKNYRGTEVEYARDNTFDTDAANDRISLNHALRKGKFTARALLSMETQNALARRDRAWLASDDRRPYGGTDKRSSANPVGGIITAVSGNLPGTSVRSVYIPAGSNGKTPTLQDYLKAPATEQYDSGLYQNALNPYQRKNANLFAEYEFAPWAVAYANYSWSSNKSQSVGNPVILTNYRMAANNPLNPFGTAVYVSKYFWELGNPLRHYTMTQTSLATGLRGDLPHDWRYQFNVSEARSRPELAEGTYQLDATKINNSIAAGVIPSLLHDSLQYKDNPGAAPNPAGLLESFYYDDEKQDRARTRSYNLAFDGPVWQWDAGPINLAVGVERREDAVKFYSDNPSPTTEANEPPRDRIVNAQYAELSVPLLSPKSSLQLPFVHSLTINGALRRDDYNDFGAATTPLAGLMFKPTSWLALRASRNKAFRVPYLIDLTRKRYTTTSTVAATGSTALTDPYRKNESYVGSLVTTLGGNPNLKPERSEHTNLGLIFDAPGELLRGLSVSVDRWASDILDRVGTISNQERMFYFPETFTRDPLTPEDAAAGYTAGKITGMDNTSMNIAKFRSAGWDYAVRFNRRTSLGELALNLQQTRTDRYEAVATPGAKPSPFTAPALRPTRTVGMVSWSHRGAGASLTVIHQRGFPVTLVPPVVNYPDTLQANMNLWYDFGHGSLHDKSGTLGRWLDNTRVSFGLINMTNKEPPLSPTGDVNSAIDPRGRRYTLTVRHRF